MVNDVLRQDLETTKERVAKLETSMEEIRAELKQKSISDARIEQILETLQTQIQIVQTDTREIRNEMMKLVMKIVEDSQKDDNEEKLFYRKLIIGSVTIFATIVLAAFGISRVINIFQ